MATTTIRTLDTLSREELLRAGEMILFGVGNRRLAEEELRDAGLFDKGAPSAQGN